MGEACYEKELDKKLIVSESTSKYAEHKISFKFYKRKKFKGKSVELPVYLPIEPGDLDYGEHSLT